jgi:hypothetical protein
MISAILPLSAPLPTRRMQLSAGSPSTGRPNLAFSRKRTKTGRIQTMVRRLLIVHGRMTTLQLMRAIYGSPTHLWHYGSVNGAAEKFAERVRKVRSRGHPVLWQLRDCS